MHKLIKKHGHKVVLFVHILKNVSTAIALKSVFFSGLIGGLTIIIMQAHFFHGHHLLNIKKHYPHQVIKHNVLQLPKYSCKKCNRAYYTVIGLLLHKINLI